MSHPAPLHVVTGAFGYSGRYIAERLLAEGVRVRTLTHSLDRKNPFGGRIEARPFDWDDPPALASHLRGADVLYNTYWVRFDHDDFHHGGAVENTLKLFEAACAAGVRRVVHVSITNPSEDSDLPYFAGKARLERALRESGLSYAILRPAVLFGKEDILVNNIAWGLRRLPVFGIFGDGSYRLQPIYVDDLAELAVEQGRTGQNLVIDAIGPQTFSYRELVVEIGRIIGRRRRIVSMPAWPAWQLTRLLGGIVGDVILTRDEIAGLMADLLVTDSLPAGRTRLTDWAERHADSLGRRYTSELARRRDRKRAYASN